MAVGKPWSKLEIDYMDHPKFSVLSASAICLWHSVKNYCDKWHTDGLVPTHEMKRFRFYAPKFLSELVTVIDFPKPDGTAYGPLIEKHAVGFKMHDYLDHNDCREDVLTRLDDSADRAELRQAANREYQATHRAKRKQELAGLRKQGKAADEVLTKAKRVEASVSESVPESVPESDPQTPSVSSGTLTRKPEHPPLDVWLGKLQEDYPQHRVTYGFMTSSSFVDIFQKDTRPATEVWAEMRANLENQKAGHEWRIKNMAPKLEKWLREGLWKQRHEATPVSELVSGKTSRTLSSGAEFVKGGASGPR